MVIVRACVRACACARVRAQRCSRRRALTRAEIGPRRAETSRAELAVLPRSSPRARGDVVATFALLRRDATARRGAAANEVSRAAARSVTKERNIAGRDITVATLLSACLSTRRVAPHRATPGPFTKGNDVASRFAETTIEAVHLCVPSRPRPRPRPAVSFLEKSSSHRSRTWKPAVRFPSAPSPPLAPLARANEQFSRRSLGGH